MITPTCDRPEALRQARAWMAAQTRQPDEWIIADGTGRPPGRQNFLQNLRRALSEVTGDVVVCWEDDDYYPPTYLAEVEAAFADPKVLILGSDRLRVYHLGAHRAFVYPNKGAALCQTSFRTVLIPIVTQILDALQARDDTWVDQALWDWVPAEYRQRREDWSPVVGLKGWPGAPGLGKGHQQDVVATWHPDHERRILRRWLGPAAEVVDGLAQRS